MHLSEIAPSVIVKRFRRSFPQRFAAVALSLIAVLALCSCTTAQRNGLATQASIETQIIDMLARNGVVMFGEVHDNRALHAERNRIVANVIAAGARPAFAFEQFDRESQSRIDTMSKTGATAAQSLIDAAAPSRSSWDWRFYRPLIDLALANRLPIVAANLSRSEAVKVASIGLQKTTAFDVITRQQLALDTEIPLATRSAQMNEIKRGHCNLLPESMLPNMADAQFARDAVIASALKTQNSTSTHGVILFAGNGHVRRDIGVPFWLDKDAPLLSIGMLEKSSSTTNEVADAAPYDVVITRDAEPREDPCIALKRRFGAATQTK
jgi:uncharacterized iron-regulated protein